MRTRKETPNVATKTDLYVFDSPRLRRSPSSTGNVPYDAPRDDASLLCLTRAPTAPKTKVVITMSKPVMANLSSRISDCVATLIESKRLLEEDAPKSAFPSEKSNDLNFIPSSPTS